MAGPVAGLGRAPAGHADKTVLPRLGDGDAGWQSLRMPAHSPDSALPASSVASDATTPVTAWPLAAPPVAASALAPAPPDDDAAPLCTAVNGPAPDWPGWLRLAQEPGLGPARAAALVAAIGPPDMLYGQPEAHLRLHVAAELAARLAAPPPASLKHEVERIQAWLAGAPDRHLLTLHDARYPAALLTLPDPPLLLYVRGQPDWLQRPALAVVGARNASAAGLDNAHAFAAHMALQGWCVVSGLARGIDAAAHQGALAAGPGCGTVAVLGTGIDRVYPSAHAALADCIAARGALISEFALGALPLKPHFPRRNRLVAGLSHGVLVVEAARESGSLGTARLAAEFGREVFALPGSIHSPLSRGCHALIREGAKLVETYADIRDELGEPVALRPFAVAGPCTAPATDDASALDRSDNAALSGDPAVLLRVLGPDPEHADTLARRSALPAARVQAGLLALELDGTIVRLADGRYQSRRMR